jgi:predicted RNA-binding protein with PUA-like domain
MTLWLIKTEPEVWSWNDQVKNQVTHWDGVRNYQARNNLKLMQVGDKALFYHTSDERQIMGIVEIIKTYYPDPTDPTGTFGMVDVKAVQPFVRPVTLSEIKADPRFNTLALVRQSRLSVMPIDEKSWEILTNLGKA